MWWYRHPSFAVTVGGSWFSRFPLVTPFFIDLTHRLRSLGLSSLPNMWISRQFRRLSRVLASKSDFLSLCEVLSKHK